ncbi:4Fe-4S dicluster domain-containing protein [Heliobacillus mobilis]|uniref:4Fe-4S dicluster domain-containing protein n=2 Tax=Heliobacterium TaxID=2697 RepID=Q0PIJ2_HELMO|nr:MULTISPECIES: NADH-quinone oxidoreductase subunit I [Heliobacterium]ABH04825.1 NAD(P)H-quinone oxidoreductase 23 kDa subunit [Heliobacterium mobile]MBC9783391.1 NADH-quinone oxidoreductase subunit I [Heliobacterium chlorum]MTV47699.1 4Fe-4S dicluster domain-containing protein [Heliobacterium mobile]
MQGIGLLKGMFVTIQEFFRKPVTEEYPDVMPDLGDRFRGGTIKLKTSKCISCGICMNSCPNGSIKLTSVRDENNKRHLSTYVHDSGLCLYCNLCIESCPVKCIDWTNEFAFSGYSREDLIFDCIDLAKKRGYDVPEVKATPEAGEKG